MMSEQYRGNDEIRLTLGQTGLYSGSLSFLGAESDERQCSVGETRTRSASVHSQTECRPILAKRWTHLARRRLRRLFT